jgi:molybdate transport system regulatory protein
MIDIVTMDKCVIDCRNKKRHETMSSCRLNGNIWVEKEGRKYLCGKNVELLEQIGRLGTISSAARYLGMGYRTAWLKVEEMNRLSPEPLVIKIHGGVGGGQAILTDEGKRTVSRYREAAARF